MNTERTENIFTRSIRKRYGIGMALLLALWPVAGFVPSLESILVNGMLVDSYRQLGFVAFINTLAWFFCISIQRLLNSRIPGVFWTQILGDGEAPWGLRRVWVTLGLASVTPLVLAFGFGSEFPYEGSAHALCAVGASLTGVFSGWIVLLAAGCLKSWLVGSDENTMNYLPFEARNSPEHPWASKLVSCFAMIAGVPVVRQIKKYTVDVFISIFKLKRIDGQFVIYLTILAVLHWSTARWLSNSESWLTSAPAMVVLLIWIVFMALSGIANGLDRYRVPVVAVVLLLLTVWLSLFGSTRDIRTTKDKSKNQFVAKLAAIDDREIEFLKSGKLGSPDHIALISDETAALEDVAWNAIVNRMQRINPNENKGKTLVVVTCPGGGIHAAAWSACVLDGLCNDFEEFEDSIGTISGVSGGSVGTLMFVSSRYSDQIEGIQPLATSMPSTEEIHEKMKQSSPALELAARSSLEQIAYGITTDDLYGLVFPPLSLSGRGQRLEDSFSMRMPDSQQEVTLGDWGDMATDGSLPIVIFNSTDAVTGRRILFDTIPTPRRASSVGRPSRPLNYRELLAAGSQGDPAARDIKPATAARTSATFPYVSPFTKPDVASSRGAAVAICDGGYVDNEGIVSAVNWIEFMLKRWAVLPPTERPFDRILLLRIEPSPAKSASTIPDSGGFFGWLRWIFGPAETMVKVRSASQIERGNLESDLAALYIQLNTGNTSEEQKREIAMKRSRMLLGSIDVPKDLIQKPAGAFRPTPSDEIFEEQKTNQNTLPVVVETIRFRVDDEKDKIPLNWKLSKVQKQWYLNSWQKCRAEQNSLNATLNRFFTPTN